MEFAARPALGKGTKNVSVCYNQHIAPTGIRTSQRLVEGMGMPFLANRLDKPVKTVVDIFGAPARCGQSSHYQRCPFCQHSCAYSPPGQPSLQMSQPGSRPCSFLNFLIRLEVIPS